MSPRRLLQAYYLATAGFLLLDLVVGVNLRIAFLEASPGLRAAYYAFCFACLAVSLWRPSWTALVGAIESSIAIAALIVSFGLRVMLYHEAVFDQGVAPVTLAEVANFAIAGTAAYVAWFAGIRELAR